LSELASWVQTTFIVDAKQVEKLSVILETFLAQSVTTENAGRDEFYEVAFPGMPSWRKVRVTGLFDGNIDVTPIIDFVQQQLSTDTGEIPHTVDKLVDQDWERAWLKSFKPIHVGHRLWVCPSWCKPTAPNERNIILDPGLAFGTGTHATTHMCLDWLSRQNLDRQRVLDYGSGSGILAIAAILSGASHADAVDIDPLAVSACKENAERNSLSDKMDCYLSDDLPNKANASYKLVIANILAEVIVELRDTLLLHLSPDGTLLLTGILTTQADRVIDAFGIDYVFTRETQDQWCLLVGHKR